MLGGGVETPDMPRHERLRLNNRPANPLAHAGALLVQARTALGSGTRKAGPSACHAIRITGEFARS